jgi:hypothetical protein
MPLGAHLIQACRTCRLPAQFGKLCLKSDARKARCDPRAQSSAGVLTALYCAPQDLAYLLLGAVTMLTCATLQSCLYVVVEPSDQDLRHDRNDSTLSRYVGQANLVRQPLNWFVCRQEKWANLSVRKPSVDGGAGGPGRVTRRPAGRLRALVVGLLAREHIGGRALAGTPILAVDQSHGRFVV